MEKSGRFKGREKVVTLHWQCLLVVLYYHKPVPYSTEPDRQDRTITWTRQAQSRFALIISPAPASFPIQTTIRATHSGFPTEISPRHHSWFRNGPCWKIRSSLCPIRPHGPFVSRQRLGGNVGRPSRVRELQGRSAIRAIGRGILLCRAMAFVLAEAPIKRCSGTRTCGVCGVGTDAISRLRPLIRTTPGRGTRSGPSKYASRSGSSCIFAGYGAPSPAPASHSTGRWEMAWPEFPSKQ